MIKALIAMRDGTPGVILGLSGENVARLVADEPIMIDLAELGLPAMTIAIMYGRTEADIQTQLQPLFGPDTVRLPT